MAGVVQTLRRWRAGSGGAFLHVRRPNPKPGRVCGVLAAAVLAWGSVACGSAVKASADWERGADLAPTKTFSVAHSPLLPKDLTPEQRDLVALVEATISKELTRKGYKEAAASDAQLVAMSHFERRERSSVSTFKCDNTWRYEMYEGAVLPAGAVAPCQDSMINKFEEGVLLIDIYDARLKELVWHGWAYGKRPDPASEKLAGIVQQATLDILERFPP
jgi:uncharacterized protein DUF4136